MYRLVFENLTPAQTHEMLQTPLDGVPVYSVANINRTPVMYSDTKLNTIDMVVPKENFDQRIIEIGRRCMQVGILLPRPELVEREVRHSYSKESVLRPLDTLDDWQSWVAERWLYEQGSDEAHDHFQGKADEEIEELKIEIANKSSEGMLAEMGDVMFCMTARAINENIDAATELATYYPTISRARDNECGQIKIDEIHNLATAECVSWCTLAQKVVDQLTDRHITDGIEELDTDTCVSTLDALCSVQASAVRVHRGLMRDLGVEFARDPHVQIKASRIERTMLDAMRFTALVANSLGYELADVLKMVQIKQWQRISSGQALTKPVATAE